MTNTTKYDLYFVSSNGKSFKTVTTKATGRNAEGVMTYENPGECFKRASQLVDFTQFKFTKASPYN